MKRLICVALRFPLEFGVCSWHGAMTDAVVGENSREHAGQRCCEQGCSLGQQITTRHPDWNRRRRCSGAGRSGGSSKLWRGGCICNEGNVPPARGAGALWRGAAVGGLLGLRRVRRRRRSGAAGAVESVGNEMLFDMTTRFSVVGKDNAAVELQAIPAFRSDLPLCGDAEICAACHGCVNVSGPKS
jgi:hypothetical protein